MKKKVYLFFQSICLAIAGLLLLTSGKEDDKSEGTYAADGPYILYRTTGGMRMIPLV